MFRCPTIAFSLLLAASCATGPTTANTVYAADGNFARHVRLRITPAQTKDFEALMTRCVAAAEKAGLSRDHGWLCYREPPGRYWLVTFSEKRDAFRIPTSADPLRAMALHIADQESDEARTEIEQRLDALEYETQWSLLMHQKREWCTVKGIDPAVHRMARLMMRTVKPGEEDGFETALERRTSFFREHAYPLPIEGFVTLAGAPGTAVQVVFPKDWPTFHATTSFYEFVKQQSDAARIDYAHRKAALMRTMSSADYYDAKHLPEQSYNGR